MDGIEAYRVINGYVIGGVAYNSDLLVDALYAMKEYGPYTSVKQYNVTVNGKKADRYDTSIVAFCNYWYKRYSDKGFQFNPNYVKAMIGVESKLGTYDGSHHGKTDVLQCLDKDNPAVYCIAKIAPSNGVAYDEYEGLNKGMIKEGYQAVKNIFNGSKPDATQVNSRLSICFGILWLGYKTAVAGTIKKGVIAYNGGGDPQYWEHVMECHNNPASYLK